MLKFFPYIRKNIWRQRARTLLTVSGSAVGLFVFCFVSAVQEGMNDLTRRQSAKSALVAFQANKFCPATSHLPQDYAQQIARLSGVREVLPVQVFTNNCRASLDVIVFYGVPAEKLRSTRDFRLLSGNWQDLERQQDGAIVGRAVAARRGVRAGEKFSIGDESFLSVSVAGIFASDDPAEENYIYCHLDFLQRRKGANSVGTVTQIEVLLDEGINPIAKCDEIDERFRGGPVQTDTRPKGVFQASSLGDLAQLISMARYLGFACVGLVLSLVATTTVMSVQDRVKQHAVLQTLGFSSARVFSLVLSECMILGALGGVLGVGAALAALEVAHLSVGAEAVTIAIAASPAIALQGVGISIIAGILAGIAPAFQASRAEIVPGLRDL